VVEIDEAGMVTLHINHPESSQVFGTDNMHAMSKDL